MDYRFTFNLDNDPDGNVFQWRITLYAEDYEEGNIASSFKTIVLSEGNDENHYYVYVMIVAPVNGELERVGGAWLFDSTPVVTNTYEYCWI